MNVFVNISYFSPYVIDYLNSFSDVNASQTTEFIISQYMYTCKRAQPAEEPTKFQKVGLVTNDKRYRKM